MNVTEHLLTCLGEEGSEVAQDVSKCLRFGLDDRNVLNPTGPTNRERLIVELNQIIAVAEMLIDLGVIPKGSFGSESAMAERQAKKDKVRKFMDYARSVGALKD